MSFIHESDSFEKLNDWLLFYRINQKIVNKIIGRLLKFFQEFVWCSGRLVWSRSHSERIFLIWSWKFDCMRVILHSRHVSIPFHCINFLSWYFGGNDFYKKIMMQIICVCNNTIRKIESNYTCIEALKQSSNKYFSLHCSSEKQPVSNVVNHVELHKIYVDYKYYQISIKIIIITWTIHQLIFFFVLEWE